MLSASHREHEISAETSRRIRHFDACVEQWPHWTRRVSSQNDFGRSNLYLSSVHVRLHFGSEDDFIWVSVFAGPKLPRKTARDSQRRRQWKWWMEKKVRFFIKYKGQSLNHLNQVLKVINPVNLLRSVPLSSAGMCLHVCHPHECVWPYEAACPGTPNTECGEGSWEAVSSVQTGTRRSRPPRAPHRRWSRHQTWMYRVSTFMIFISYNNQY